MLSRNRTGCQHPFTHLMDHRKFRSCVALAACFAVVSSASAKPAGETNRSPREGGAYGLGGIWFDVEPEPEQPASSAKDATEEAPGSWFDFTWVVTTAGLYETRPARHASDHPDWHWDTELAPELEWGLSEVFSISASGGMRLARYANEPDLDSNESFGSVQFTWRPAPLWMASLRHESFWDFDPGFAQKVFAAHTTGARLQYDTSAPDNPSPVRWQSYAELAHSFAEPSLHDWFGGAVGGGCAIRIVPRKLRLQIGAGASYQIYPNYEVAGDETRRGWNLHTTTALVWTPGERTRVTFGIDWMRSFENDPEFRFTNISVPLSVTWMW